MTSQQILQADLLEILFEKRNKLYGAYELRKAYPRQLGKALFLAIAPVLLLLFLFPPSAGTGEAPPDFGGVEVIDVEAIPPELKKPPLPPPQAQLPVVKQQRFIDQIQIVPTDAPTDMPPVDAFDRAAVSAQTVENGREAHLLAPPAAKAAESPATVASNEPQKEVVPDRQPAFPGGMQAWLAFLNRHLRVPEEMEAGEKKTALIRFHVAEDGSVTGFQVLQTAGAPFDNEVIRVLKKMPNWMPATKGGQPVAVGFTQAVTFVGAEE